MAGVFISYSRKDRDVAGRLHRALTERGKDVWIDLEDIPPSAEWMKRITDAIDASNAIVFLLSEHSVSSRVCEQEVGHAAGRQKRLIPVSLGVSDPSKVPQTLQKLNWINLDATAAFDDSVALLIEAIDTDLAHVDLHTRLLVRAAEWEQHGKDASYLLRGSDLREAERWQGQSGGKQPLLSRLHTEYIQASRGGESRRLRIVAYASLTAVVVSVALAIVALLQGQAAQVEAKRATFAAQDAIDARERTEDRQKRNLARQLAAEAELSLSQGALLVPRAALLSIEALRREESLITDRAARKVLRLLPAPLCRLALDADDQCKWLAASAGGRFCAVTTDKGRVLVYDSDGGRVVARLRDSGGESISFEADDKILLSHGSPSLAYRVSDWTEVYRTSEGEGRLSISRDGLRAISSWRDGTVRIMTLEPRAEAARFAHSSTPSMFLEKPNGRSLVTLAGTGGQPEIFVWDISSGKLARRIPCPDGATWLAISPDGAFAVEAPYSLTPGHVWDTLNGKIVAELPMASQIANPKLVFSADSSRLVIAADDHTVRVLRAPRFSEESRGSTTQEIYQVAVSADGARFAAASDDNTARVWNSHSGREIARRVHGEYVPYLALSPDGSAMFSSAQYSHSVFGSRVSDWCESIAFAHGDPYAKTVRWSQDGTTVIVEGEKVTVARTLAGAVVAMPDGRHGGRTVPFPERKISRADVDRWFASCGVTAKQLGVSEGEGQLLLSPDGRYLCHASPHWVVSVFDGQEGGRRVVRATHEAMLPDVQAFSGDSKLFVTTSAGYESTTTLIQVFDLPSGIQRMYLDVPFGSTAAAFSPDNTRLAVCSTDAMTRVYLLRKEDLIAELSGRLRRNLTEQEWDRSMPGVAYAPTIDGLPTPVEDEGAAGSFEDDPDQYTIEARAARDAAVPSSGQR